jgi:ribose 5-phosphate isomerase B
MDFGKRQRTEGGAYSYGQAAKGIAIGSDHAGFGLKKLVMAHIRDKYPALPVIDCGAYSEDRVDYPDIAAAVCKSVLSGASPTPCNRGILLDGAGVASGIAANKFNGIRAGVVHDHFSTSMGRKHNDVNVVCFGGKTLGIEAAKEIVDVFLTCEFEGDRHLPRLGKLEAIESSQGGGGGGAASFASPVRSSTPPRFSTGRPSHAASPFKLM